MKAIFVVFIVMFLVVTGCRNNDGDLQYIDQIAEIYIDSLGQDMLNSNIPGSYSSVSMNDVYGITDNAPVSFTPKKDADTISYLEYISGAKRILIDSANDNHRKYESKIALKLTRKVNDSVYKISNDTMVLQYDYLPEIFRINKVTYNGVLVFTKVPDQPNRIKISK